MKKTVIILIAISFIVAGCAGTWMSRPLESFKPAEAVPPASNTSAMITMGILFQVPNWISNGYMCQACHTVHGGSASERWGRMGVGFCVVCHFVDVALVS